MYQIVDTGSEVLVAKDENVIERFPLKPWEAINDSLAKLKAIEFVRRAGKFGTYFDFLAIITKVKNYGKK